MLLGLIFNASFASNVFGLVNNHNKIGSPNKKNNAACKLISRTSQRILWFPGRVASPPSPPATEMEQLRDEVTKLRLAKAVFVWVVHYGVEFSRLTPKTKKDKKGTTKLPSQLVSFPKSEDEFFWFLSKAACFWFTSNWFAEACWRPFWLLYGSEHPRSSWGILREDEWLRVHCQFGESWLHGIQLYI